MKKIISLIVVFVLAMSLTGCGVKEKLGEKVAEKIIKDIGIGDIDIDGDEITIKGEDGEKLVIGEAKWPKSALAKKIPELKDGKVVGVLETKESLVINLEEVSEKNFTNYLEKIKRSYPDEFLNMESDGDVTYAAEDGKGFGVMVMYTTGGDVTISVTKTS